MPKAIDPRTQRTQLLIRDAFMGLLIERGFDKITVRAITEQAKINRATFYRHYTDIHHLSFCLTDLLFIDINTQLNEKQDISDAESWTILFEHVAQYATFYRAMMGENGIPGFRDRVQESVEDGIRNRLDEWGIEEGKTKVPLSLAIRYMAAAQVGFIQWWLENDMPFPPLEATNYMLNLHQYGGMWALTE